MAVLGHPEQSLVRSWLGLELDRLQLGCIAQSRHPEQSLAMFWLGHG